jgi:hypothetical protein
MYMFKINKYVAYSRACWRDGGKRIEEWVGGRRRGLSGQRGE